MPSIVQPDQKFRIERVESCGKNNGPHNRIKKRTEDDPQLPREQEQNAEEGDGKYLFAGHRRISVLLKGARESAQWAGIPLPTDTTTSQTTPSPMVCVCRGFALSRIAEVKWSRGVFLPGPLGFAATLVTRLIDGLGILIHPIAAGLIILITLHFPTRLTAPDKPSFPLREVSCTVSWLLPS